jgi:rod shape-determining protein MreB
METTDLPVHIAEDPLTAVVRGTGEILEDLDFYRTVIT